jgi:hypothetical protein
MAASVALKPFRDHIPVKPYCTDDLSAGLQIRPLQAAIGKAYIQHNGPGMIWTMAFDVDRPIVDPKTWSPVWEDANLQPPNVAVQTPSTGRGHLLYYLAAGVCTTSAARLKPMEYLAAIERAYTVALGADRGYAKLVTKNPFSQRWRVWEIHGNTYTLDELAAWVDLTSHSSPPKVEEAYGTGRNVTLFHQARFWAYSAIRDYWAPGGLDQWHKAVLGRVEALNAQFSAPLPFSEVRAIAKSISRWTWRKITPQGLQEFVDRTHTPEQQRERGKRASNQAEIAHLGGKASGEARRAAKEDVRTTAVLMWLAGQTTRQIAEQLGVHYATVSRWVSD